MPRHITTAQFNNLREVATRPINLIRWELSGSLELLSTSGQVTFDDEVYSAGGVDLVSIEDSVRAVLSVPADADRVAQTLGGTWRNGRICQIYAIPAMPGDSGEYTTDDGLLILDGIINRPSLQSGRVVVEVVHKFMNGRLTPRATFNEITNHIPAAGTTLTWEGETFTLKARR